MCARKKNIKYYSYSIFIRIYLFLQFVKNLFFLLFKNIKIKL